MNEREPDISDDPRKQGTGQGYPETNPGASTPAEGTEQGPGAGAGDPPERSDAEQDEAPSDATGNPGAAGG